MNRRFNDFNNFRVAALPAHLREYIVEQQYEHYTPVDHAVWRYVMRQNYSFLKDIAYYPYIPGLKNAGLTIERIPELQEMNDALGKIGWGAVTVDGFIPPSAFMEYQEYHVLVIAADIRQLKHIEYTPAPDIIHESAGHAPIIAEPDYNRYLSYFGSIGSKALFSSGDFELYEAIRELSILKEMPGATAESIREAEEKVSFCQQNIGEPSEMALLSRLHWWTVEYGLIGTPENPKIYGAGLLSSIGESASCMDPAVQKLWYSIDAVNYSYDITNRQPQLFVTPDFHHLITVLDQFADTMAFRTGGASGIEKAISSGKVATAVYSSGLQVSGKFSGYLTANDQLCFIQVAGPASLSYKNKTLTGHDRTYPFLGFSSPVGKIKRAVKPLEDYDQDDLAGAGILPGARTRLEFESGILVEGIVGKITRVDSKVLVITFNECTVEDAAKNRLFDPSQGPFDMAVGEKITAVLPGEAVRDEVEEGHQKPAVTTYHPMYTEEEKNYHALFKIVRDCREHDEPYSRLGDVFETLLAEYPEDWLCMLEILEILEEEPILPGLAGRVRLELENKAASLPEYHQLIQNGLNLAGVTIG